MYTCADWNPETHLKPWNPQSWMWKLQLHWVWTRPYYRCKTEIILFARNFVLISAILFPHRTLLLILFLNIGCKIRWTSLYYEWNSALTSYANILWYDSWKTSTVILWPRYRVIHSFLTNWRLYDIIASSYIRTCYITDAKSSCSVFMHQLWMFNVKSLSLSLSRVTKLGEQCPEHYAMSS